MYSRPLWTTNLLPAWLKTITLRRPCALGTTLLPNLVTGHLPLESVSRDVEFAGASVESSTTTSGAGTGTEASPSD